MTAFKYQKGRVTPRRFTNGNLSSEVVQAVAVQVGDCDRLHRRIGVSCRLTLDFSAQSIIVINRSKGLLRVIFAQI